MGHSLMITVFAYVTTYVAVTVYMHTFIEWQSLSLYLICLSFLLTFYFIIFYNYFPFFFFFLSLFPSVFLSFLLPAPTTTPKPSVCCTWFSLGPSFKSAAPMVHLNSRCGPRPAAVAPASTAAPKVVAVVRFTSTHPRRRATSSWRGWRKFGRVWAMSCSLMYPIDIDPSRLFRLLLLSTNWFSENIWDLRRCQY